MLNFTWLIPAIPFAGFLILALFGRRFSKSLTSIIGAGSVGLAALLNIFLTIDFVHSVNAGQSFTQTVWLWFNVDNFAPTVAFHVDSLSLVFTFVITFVGFLIHLYSVEYMADEEGYSRFFSYMNLFIGFMLTLVLADNLLLLYLGWEGVGLCSYLLIGFFYRDTPNVYAANKAFIVTRIGDTAMFIGLLILFAWFHTLNINDIMQQAPTRWGAGSPWAIAAAALLLGGALGKSAQLPLQTWLPDAMAGPSPVSALIHAATMVTAGVYLIARTHVLFSLAPVVQAIVAIIGAATLLIAGFSALAQYDLKRVLAYSTISQIGYMFLALGVGAWSAGVFHFMIHGFFKALLFLGGGAAILAVHHEQNIFKMGGLRNKIPLVFWTFVIGSAALSALPLITAGFYSKDAILWFAWSSSNGSPILWFAGILGAFLTSLYTFRMIFIAFFGEEKTHVSYKPGILISIPLVILAILSIVGGFIEMPESLGNVNIFNRFLSGILPEPILNHTGVHEGVLQLLSGIVSLLGIYLAYIFFLKRPATDTSTGGNALTRFFLKGWNFDLAYDFLFVRPYIYISRKLKNDFIDWLLNGLAKAAMLCNKLLVPSQNGRLNWYLTGIALGIIILLTIMIYL